MRALRHAEFLPVDTPRGAWHAPCVALPVDVLIVTALAEELNALLEVTEGIHEPWARVEATHPYHQAVLRGREGLIRVTAARVINMGGVRLAATIQSLIAAHDPKLIAVCGICAGHIRETELGDVVIADRVLRYDHDSRGIQFDVDCVTLDDRWIWAAQDLVGPATSFSGYAEPNIDAGRWWFLEQLLYDRNPLHSAALRRYIRDDYRAELLDGLVSEGLVDFENGDFSLTDKGRAAAQARLVFHGGLVTSLPFHVHVGPLASGDLFVRGEDVWAKFRAAGQRKTIAVDMEAAAIVHVARDREVSSLVVKGVVDHADRNKTDRFKSFAARASAEVLCSMLRHGVAPRAVTVAVTDAQSRTSPSSIVRNVQFSSFKSLADVSLDLGLVNVFVGANGSGKSNLLEALGLLGAAASGRVDDEGLLRRGVRPGVPGLYKSSFRAAATQAAIRLAAFSDEARYEVELQNPTHDPRPAWHYQTETLQQGNQDLVERSLDDTRARNPDAGLAALEIVEHAPDAPAARLLAALRDYAIYAPNTPTLRGLLSDPQTREPVGLGGGRLADAIEELHQLAQSDEHAADVIDDLLELIDWVEAFGARPGSAVPLSPSIPRQRQVLYFRDRFMAPDRNELSGYDASEGALYVLFAMVIATHPRAPKLAAIDNVDAGLNPRLARALIERLCKRVLADGSRQLLLTSHNPLVLDGLPLQDDRVRLFAVDRSAHGRTIVRRVRVTPELLAKAEEGWPLSRLWVSGHLGGVPDV